MAWVIYGVTLHDYVELSDGQVVRMMAQDDRTVTIARDGTQEQISRSRVATAPPRAA